VPKRPNLSILPAFGDNADFGRLHAEGPWRRLLVDDPIAGLEFFDAVLGVLGEGRDHVLIDSRTGITDVGGLLSAVLPHLTVLVASYGQQSLEGFTYVRKALERATGEDGQLPVRQRLDPGARLEILHVLSPVPAETEEAVLRRQAWTEMWPSLAPIEVPFDLRLLWSEHLLVAEDLESPAGRAYSRIAARVAAARAALLEALEESAATEVRYPQTLEAREGDGSFRDRPGDRTARGWTFERRVGRLLELHGYMVEPEQLLGGNRVDLVARLATGLEEQCWWVECKDHRQAVPKKVLSELAEWLDTDDGKRQRARGMVVARSFSPAAVTFAAQRVDIKVWTVDELERRLFDARPYLTSLVQSFESSTLARTYVHQRVWLEDRPAEEAVVELLAHAVAWAHGAGNRLWLLLGDYGTGKSVFFRRFGCELAKAALADPEAPIPIAIDLKEFPNATSAETLFFEHLKRYAPDFRGNSEALRHLLAAGRAVLLLDGFDEMGVAAAGRSVDEQFRELARLAGEEPLEPKRGNRVLVTCRTHFFRDQQQVKDAATGKLEGFTPKASEDSALGRLARRFAATID
ncbi:MAG: restriction endonuclease, partial [Thermoanaerobaculia bacterium]|nr:restriction endonuclease [Thermoanaerobaculia bacterium]